MSGEAQNPMDPSAYGSLLEPLLAQAGGYARSILRTREDAEDAVQQAALRGLRRLDTFDGRCPFKGWWFTILRNCCFDLQRRAKLRTTVPMATEPACDQGRSEAWAELADALERLSPEHRDVLRLRYFGGLTYDELAAALAIPRGTVMSRLHYAREALARQMKLEDT